MKARLVLLMVISAVLMSATIVNAQACTSQFAIAVMKDTKNTTMGLATFIQDESGLVHINV